MPTDLSIVIVNHNTRDMLQLCLENVFSKVQGVSFEVFVVDNASHEDSTVMVAKKFPRVNLIQNKENLGFAIANNIALEQCSGEFVLLLNPDCFLLDSFGKQELEFMKQNPSVGVLGTKLLNNDGSLQHSCRSFPNYFSPLFGRTGLFTKLFPNNSQSKKYLLSGSSHSEVRDVDWVIGACMIVRKSLLDEIGLLDPYFFLFCDDLDLCYRTKKAGYRVVYHPRTKAIHLIGTSTGQVKLKSVILHHKSMYYFFKKHYSLPVIVKPVVWLGMGLNVSYYLLAGLASKIRGVFLQSYAE